MNYRLLFVGALMVGCAALWAQAAPGGGDKPAPAREDTAKEDSKKDAARADPFKVYRTKGNSWTTRTTTKRGSEESVTHTRYEVTEVKENEATVKVTNLDKDQVAMGEPYTYAQPIKAKEAAEPGAEEKKKPVIEKIKVEAGEFECTKRVTEFAGTKTTSWTCNVNSILVKSESSSDTGSTTIELVKDDIK